jgi:hypothetical protein
MRASDNDETQNRDHIMPHFLQSDIEKGTPTDKRSQNVHSNDGLSALMKTRYYRQLRHKEFLETGPKPHIKVLSRIPFSDMYQQLTPSETTKFRELFEKYFFSMSQSEVKPYFTEK